MKKVKSRKKQSVLPIIGAMIIILGLSVGVVKTYSFIMNKYREHKIVQQVYQYLNTLENLLQSQNSHEVINTTYYQNKWSIISKKDIPFEISENECTFTERYHENGSQIMYCNNLLFGRDFTPDYAYTDYRDFQNIYGGEIFILLGEKVCKNENGDNKLCSFVRFYDLPREACIKVALLDWQNFNANIRINNSYQFFFDIMANDFAVNKERDFWKDNLIQSEAEELCFRPNNWIDFIIYKK